MTTLDPNEKDPAILWAEIHMLRAKMHGGAFLVERGAFQTAINMLTRDGEAGFAARGELAKELAQSVIPTES